MIERDSLHIDVPRNSKNYQNKDFDMTGEWQARHSLWLDIRVKPDGEYKNPSFRIVDDMIINSELPYVSEQQTQGSFKSVGTNDILTKSLENDKYSGQTHRQSKFVRQSHYFNIMQSSRDNAEVSAVKRQLVVLERTVQELCTKHGINRETMAEENTTSTVNQHNRFKASYTQNEKEPGGVTSATYVEHKQGMPAFS
ncbi:hypothetical protein TIFTF001_007811 [Ficus carica]|uniref:Uncharacterized protein n=1 Tax=Ficus carica TaxID=3494 RepID=A0AA88CXG2_FICCA|nr:hypothetical protein TIFTF001_007811 [Ficus carica]